jgi:four helix bundle protein
MKSFRELLVWQKSMSLVTDIYTATLSFPKSEIYGLTSQIRRSAVSIPSNIAEGFGRKADRDFCRFLSISLGSCYELQTQIEITRNLNFIDNAQFNQLSKELEEVEKMIKALISSIRKKLP